MLNRTQAQLQVPPRGGTGDPPVFSLPDVDDIGIRERNRIVNLAEELYVTGEMSGKEMARNVEGIIRLYREGRPPTTMPGSPHLARVLFLKLKREYPGELSQVLAK